MKPTMSDAELEGLLERISNWGRWGKVQRGALNYIDDSKRAAAARMVEHGHTVSLSLPLDTVAAPDNFHPVVHLMHQTGPDGKLDLFPHSAQLLHDIAARPHQHPSRRALPYFLARQNVQRLRCRRGHVARRAALCDRLAARGHRWPRRSARHPQRCARRHGWRTTRASFRRTSKRPKRTITCRSAKAISCWSAPAARVGDGSRVPGTCAKVAPGWRPRAWDGCMSGASPCWVATVTTIWRESVQGVEEQIPNTGTCASLPLPKNTPCSMRIENTANTEAMISFLRVSFRLLLAIFRFSPRLSPKRFHGEPSRHAFVAVGGADLASRARSKVGGNCDTGSVSSR